MHISSIIALLVQFGKKTGSLHSLGTEVNVQLKPIENTPNKLWNGVNIYFKIIVIRAFTIFLFKTFYFNPKKNNTYHIICRCDYYETPDCHD